MRCHCTIAASVVVILLACCQQALAFNPWSFPPLPPPDQYGTILINRTSQQHGVKAVAFSHWSHRRLYTCRVCHLELLFEMKTNATEITEEKNRSGQFCGACHDGKQAFGHTAKERCDSCHSGTISFGAEGFDTTARLPKTAFGNRIDWVYALQEALIQPKQSLTDPDYKPLTFNRKLLLQARMNAIPPAVFPHEEHNQWLDCSNCHPDIFNVEKKTTKHFEMNYILQGKFCGACHLKVAFPLDDCKRCHPKMRN